MEKIIENKVLYLAGRVGKLIIKYGGETYKAEEAVQTICNHYHMEAHSMALPSSIIISIHDKSDNFYTNVEKITSRTIDIGRITKIDELLKTISNYKFDEFARKMYDIENETPYPFKFVLLGNCIAAAAFAFFFSGGVRDSISSFFSGAIISVICYKSQQMEINNFFINLIGGATATLVSYIFFRVELVSDISVSIIAVIMLLVPGISFTNSIRDLISGDLVTGISRGVESFIVGTALAIGSGITLSIIKTLGGI